MLPVTIKTDEGEQLLRRNQVKSKRAGIDDVDPTLALKRLQIGIISAWEKGETHLPHWLKEADKLTFNGLARLLGLATDTLSNSSTMKVVPLVKRTQGNEDLLDVRDSLRTEIDKQNQTRH